MKISLLQLTCWKKLCFGELSSLFSLLKSPIHMRCSLLRCLLRPCLMPALQCTCQYQGLRLIPSVVSMSAGSRAWGSCLSQPAQPVTVWSLPDSSWTTTYFGQVKMLECRLVVPFHIRWTHCSCYFSAAPWVHLTSDERLASQKKECAQTGFCFLILVFVFSNPVYCKIP